MFNITGAIHIPKHYAGVDRILCDLTFTNPFEEDKIFKAFFSSKTNYIIPRGYPIQLADNILDIVDSSANFELSPGYSLNDYQEPVITSMYEYLSSLEYGQCLLSAATGSGKSYSLAALLTMLKKKTLILSHLSMLSTQMLGELKTNLKVGDVALVKSGMTAEELPDVGICSFQLLDMNKELLKLCSEHYAVVIVDEAENSVTTSRLRTLYTLKPRYQIYLTATPTRELLQQTRAVEYLYGGKIFYMNPPNDKRIHSKHLMVDYRDISWESPYNQNMYKPSLGRFFIRSKITKDIIETCAILKQQKVKGTFWIVVDYGKLQDYFKEHLEAKGLSVGIIRSATSKKQRELLLTQIANGELDILIGSAPLSAGLSIPQLSIAFRVMPNSSSEELLEQQRGRLNRFADFKAYQHPVWVDLAINGNLLYGAKKRYKLYQNTTYGVRFIKPSNLSIEIIKEIKCLEN